MSDIGLVGTGAEERVVDSPKNLTQEKGLTVVVEGTQNGHEVGFKLGRTGATKGHDPRSPLHKTRLLQSPWS